MTRKFLFPPSTFPFHLSSAQKILGKVYRIYFYCNFTEIYTKNNLKNTSKNFLRARGVKRNMGVGRNCQMTQPLSKPVNIPLIRPRIPNMGLWHRVNQETVIFHSINGRWIYLYFVPLPKFPYLQIFTKFYVGLSFFRKLLVSNFFLSTFVNL
jgi:hypothetical protein